MACVGKFTPSHENFVPTFQALALNLLPKMYKTVMKRQLLDVHPLGRVNLPNTPILLLATMTTPKAPVREKSPSPQKPRKLNTNPRKLNFPLK